MKSQVSVVRRISAILGIVFLLAGCAPVVTPAQPPPATETPQVPMATQTVPPLATETPQVPVATPLLVSKHPDLILASNRPVKNKEFPQHVVYSLPDMDRVLLAYELPFFEDLLVDISYPPGYQFGSKLPVVILVHSDTSKDWQEQIDFSEFFAVSGMIAVSPQAGTDPMKTLNSLLVYLDANADVLGVDITRIGFLGIADVWPASYAFGKSPYRDNFRAAAFSDASLSYIPKSWPKNLSLFVVITEKDREKLIPNTNLYVDVARSNQVPVEVFVVKGGNYAYDVYEDNQASKDAIQKILDFLKGKLLMAE